MANLPDASGSPQDESVRLADKMPKLQNTYPPGAILPALIAFPKERECKHRAAWPLCGGKICKPQIQFVLVGGVRFVSPCPIVR